jgi:hypothetical protein
MNGQKVCLDGETLKKMRDELGEISKPQAVLGEMNRGCTVKTGQSGDDVFSYERDCDLAAGAAATSHISFSGGIDHMHQHMDVLIAGGGAPDRLYSTDLELAYLGVCPSNVKPGQVLMTNGAVIEVYGLQSSLSLPSR